MKMMFFFFRRRLRKKEATRTPFCCTALSATLSLLSLENDPQSSARDVCVCVCIETQCEAKRTCRGGWRPIYFCLGFEVVKGYSFLSFLVGKGVLKKQALSA